ncbi:MAG: hypothetical protein Q8L46_00670, partial [candidate division WWE3 bacterium]|nr:hypothetical protein [candidate division WWE3 bacterium]
LNPAEITNHWKNYPYSSFPYYTGEKSANWVAPFPVISYFSSHPLLPNKFSYEKFVEDYVAKPSAELGPLTLED